MPTVFDNIETEFLENISRNGLRDALKVAVRGDFCVGYFNLRGWRHIDDVVEKWQSTENEPSCRLVATATRIIQEERRDTQSGQLGNRRGARYRTYERMQDYLRYREGDLFLNDQVRSAIQAVYDHPLTTEAVDKLNRQLRTGISDDDLAQLVTTIHRDDRLVVANVNDTELKQPRILCSMGLAEAKATMSSKSASKNGYGAEPLKLLIQDGFIFAKCNSPYVCPSPVLTPEVPARPCKTSGLMTSLSRCSTGTTLRAAIC